MFDVPAQYVATAVDFLFRPGAFARAQNNDKSQYLNPYAFLVTNIALAGAVTVAVAAKEADDWAGQGRGAVVVSIVAAAHLVMAIIAGRLSAYLLNESVDTSVIIASFCYSSVFYVVLFPLIASSGDWDAGPDGWLAAAGLTGVQAVAVLYLLPAICRLSSLFGRRLLAFVTVATSVELLIVLAISVVTVLLFLDAKRTAREDRSREDGAAFAARGNDVRLQATTTGGPFGAITIPARELRPDSAQLVGARIGGTREWFDFGDTEAMGYSVDALNGVGTAKKLRPGKRYYFRYVVTNDTTASFGDTKSFVTPYQ